MVDLHKFPPVPTTQDQAHRLTWGFVYGTDPHLAAVWGPWSFRASRGKGDQFRAVATHTGGKRLVADQLPNLGTARRQCDAWFRTMRGLDY